MPDTTGQGRVTYLTLLISDFVGYFREMTDVNSRDKRIDILSQKDGHRRLVV